MDVRLVGVRYACEDVRLFDLADASGRALPAVSAGSHLELRLPNDLVRTYFIAERTRRGTYTIGVRREADGAGSKYLHDKVRVGAMLRIAALHRNANADFVARRTIVVAEDVGIFRAWPLVRALDARGAAWELHYDAWSREKAPLLDALRAFGSRVRTHLRRENAGRALPWDEIVSRADESTRIDLTGTSASRTALADALERDGRPAAPKTRFTSTVPDAPHGSHDFDVVLARSNVTIPVRTDQTILEAITRAGIGVPHFCGAGLCGTCRTRVIEGVPEHRDAILSERERASNAVMMICRSRAEAGERLVLDL